MSNLRHHRDYSENEEIQLPVPKRVPIDWSDEDDSYRALAETSSWEIRIWRKVKELYGIDATGIIPPNTTASFLSDRETNNVPVWAILPARRLTKLLKCPIFSGHPGLNLLHYSMLLARFHRLPHSSMTPNNTRVRQYLENHMPPLPEPPRNLPLHSDFTKNIKRCAEQNRRESSVALGISSLDFDIIINSWDVYVRENPEHGLKTVAEYSARRTERIPASENGAILQMKKRALVNAFRRPADRIADDAQMPEEPNDLESPDMTSDDESPIQGQEDFKNLERQSEPMAENTPPGQPAQHRRDGRREPVAQNHYQSDSEDSEYQPRSKAPNGAYNRSRKHQGNRDEENSEHRPDSVAQYQSSEYSAQHQSESEGSDHQLSPATLNKASDNLSVRQGRGRRKAGARNRMMKPPSPQGGPSSCRPLSKQNPPVLAEVIVISSDDEYPIQKRSNRAGLRRGKPLPETTRTRSSEHLAQVRPKKESKAEPIIDNGIGLYARSRRGAEDSGLEGEAVATDPMTRTRLSDSPIQYQGGPSHRTKLPSYSMQRRTGWEDSDIEDEDNQPEPPNSLSDCRQKESAESHIQSLPFSAQHQRRDRSAGDQLGLTPRTKSQNHSNNSREESYPELNDWSSLYDEDLGDDEESERYIPEEKFRVHSFGFKDPALVGGNDEVRRRRREQLKSTITRNTSESLNENKNQRSEEDVRTSWHNHTPHMLVEGERIHGALGSEVKAFDKVLLQEANIQSDNGMRALSISEEKEIVPWKRLSDRK